MTSSQLSLPHGTVTRKAMNKKASLEVAPTALAQRTFSAARNFCDWENTRRCYLFAVSNSGLLLLCLVTKMHSRNVFLLWIFSHRLPRTLTFDLDLEDTIRINIIPNIHVKRHFDRKLTFEHTDRQTDRQTHRWPTALHDHQLNGR